MKQIKILLLSLTILVLALTPLACSNGETTTTQLSLTNVTTSDITITSAKVAWTTNESCTSQVEYGTTTAYESTTTKDTTLATSHSVNLSGLDANTAYHFKVKSEDEYEFTTVSADNNFTTVGTKISAITVAAITKSSATVTWTTDKPALSQVQYGKTDAYGTSTTKDATLKTSHSVNLTSLDRDTSYHFKVKSEDSTGYETASTDNTFDTKQSQIAFASMRDDNAEVYVMNADGTGQTNITNNAAADTRPDWSPDDSKIVFASNRGGDFEIYVMDLDGSNIIELTDNTTDDFSPDWSPDGTKIVFYSQRDGNREIYVMDADGTDQTRLTLPPKTATL